MIKKSLKPFYIVLGAMLAIGGALIGGFYGTRSKAPQLAAVSASIAAEYPEIAHWTPSQLAAADGKLILLDVREPGEYAVSHLQNAVRISPSSSEASAAKVIPADVENATIVFYCSVGARSSALADKLRGMLIARGAKQVVNLRGGIFAWHNEGRSLVSRADKATQDKATQYVHPYSESWGRLVDRRALTRMTKETG